MSFFLRIKSVYHIQRDGTVTFYNIPTSHKGNGRVYDFKLHFINSA